MTGISGIGYNEMQGDLGSQFRYVKGAIDGVISRNVLKKESQSKTTPLFSNV